MTQHAKKQYRIVRIIKNIMKLDIWGLILPPLCATLGIGITLSGFHCHHQQNNIGNNEDCLKTKWSGRDALRFLATFYLIT